LLEVGEVRGVDLEPGTTVDTGGKSIRSPIAIGGQNDVVSGIEQAQYGVLRGETTGKGEPEGGSLEHRQVSLEAGARRVARPGVLKAPVFTDAVLLEGRREINRCVDGTGRRIDTGATVYGAGLESR
jgi:hypothetical protein